MMIGRLILAAFAGIVLITAPAQPTPLFSPPSPLPTETETLIPTDTPTPSDTPTPPLTAGEGGPTPCEHDCPAMPPRCPTVLWNHPAGCTPTPARHYPPDRMRP
jgi:hypothetical protein